MSRSGYSYDCEHLELYRGAVASAIRGKRGQAFLRELSAALDALPEKRLIADLLEDGPGEVCAIGAVGKARGLDMSKIDYDDPQRVAEAFGISRALAAEIEYENDERPFESGDPAERESRRWLSMRKWVADHLKEQEVA